MARIALYAPTLLKLNPAKRNTQPLAGAELSLLHLHHTLERLGHMVVCFTNLKEPHSGMSLRALNDFNEKDYEIVIYSRTYGLKLSVHNKATRRVLWLHDTVEEAASLVAGGIATIGQGLCRYHHLVFVSAWQRMQYSACFPTAIDWSRRATSIWHLLPELSIHRRTSKNFDVIHTAHPRKALPAVLDIYDLLAAKRPSLRLALVNAAEIYQDSNFFYGGGQTNLSKVLKARYGKAGPPFTVLPAMPQDELILLLSQCEILLHPDQSTETGATTVLEAFLAGCGTVVSDLGCLPEMVGMTGHILPAPGTIALQVYVNSICVALDRRDVRVTCDVGQNIRDHNMVQTSRWSKVLTTVCAPRSKPRIVINASSSYRDINAVLAEHPQHLTLALVVPKAPASQIAVHLFPKREMALIGLIVPVMLPVLHGDIDALTSAFTKALGKLIERLNTHGISRLVMRISCHSVPSAVLAAWLCAASIHGAHMLKIRQLSIDLRMTQDDEQRERQTLSLRVRQQIVAARTMWIIRRLSGNSIEFDTWYDAYDKHRSAFNAIGLVRKRVRELLNSDGELGVHGALAIDTESNQIGGFYLILRVGEFATLYSWGTNQRYRSNLHKLLIADAVRLARQLKVKYFEYGSDLSEYGLHDGLSMLYQRFGGKDSPSMQLELHLQGVSPRYIPT